jgi:hypothetical protein
MKPRIAASIARNPASLLIISDDFFKSANNTFKKGPITRSMPTGPWKIRKTAISSLIVKTSDRNTLFVVPTPAHSQAPAPERVEIRFAASRPLGPEFNQLAWPGSARQWSCCRCAWMLTRQPRLRDIVFQAHGAGQPMSRSLQDVEVSWQRGSDRARE